MMEKSVSLLEESILLAILAGGIKGHKRNPMSYATVAYIVWQDRDGRIEMGPCRWGHKNNYITNHGTFNSWSVSPCPGSWIDIIFDQIIRVRHIDAL